MQHRGFLQLVVPDFLIFCDQHPALLSNKREPLGVFSSRLKVTAVTFMLHALLSERVEDGLAVVKIFVEIQNEVFRQRPLPRSAPTGLLLQSAAA